MQRVKVLQQALRLEPHPEGGYYQRVFASEETFPQSGSRSLATSIVYLLQGAQFSAFHRLQSQELWQLGEGTTGFNIIELHPEGIREIVLDKNNPVYCVQKNIWFASELINKSEQSFALAYCTVVPGFDFVEFEMAAREDLLHAFPFARNVIERLTRL